MTTTEWRAPVAPPPPPPPAARPLWKKKRFIIPAALIALATIGGIAGGSKKADTPAIPVQQVDQAGSVTSTSPPTTAAKKPDAKASPTTAAPKAAAPSRLYPGRPDSQKEDQELPIGGDARVSGYTATVTATKFVQQFSMFEKEGYVVADVKILNRDTKTQPYNVFDWKLQTPGGRVIDPTFAGENSLGSGDLVPGGSVTGTVTFPRGKEAGAFYIIYKPDFFDAARGIWKATL